MKTGKNPPAGRKLYSIGYHITLCGSALILLWTGIFKFTPTEAAAIKPLLAHHPLTFWVYDVFSVQDVSGTIGLVEMLISLLLMLSLRFHTLRMYAGLGMVIMFLITFSYLFTTPGMWRVKDGVPVTDYFILKDLAYLGFGVMLLGFQDKKKLIKNEKQK